MNEEKKLKKMNPSRILVLGFLLIIAAGALFLASPAATADGEGMNFHDAVFTATSAVCVTGLVVEDTGTFLSRAGQIAVLIMIQLGGLGFMTFATVMLKAFGLNFSLGGRMILQEELNQDTYRGLGLLAVRVFVLTAFFELAGTVILYGRFLQEMLPREALFNALFQAVSAFNNAGFDLFGDFASLNSYRGDFTVMAVTAFLLITGGLGFIVIYELIEKLRARDFSRLTLHTRLVLIINFSLLFCGWLFFYVNEIHSVTGLSANGGAGLLVESFFQSATSRTAGFSTVDMGSLQLSSRLILVLLMFVGANPGSTGGGIKTTTFGVFLLNIRRILSRKTSIDVFHRTVTRNDIDKATAVFSFGLVWIFFVTIVLSLTEPFALEDLLFETVSAFGTVGLSTGITGSLSAAGKTAVIFSMFIGRLGPLTVAYALSTQRAEPDTRHPEEKILIG